MNVAGELVVVKVGGSLYDLPDLGQRLAAWLETLTASKILLVPGGGATADVVRDFDRCHGLGETTGHELALRSLTMNAWFLAVLLHRTAHLLLSPSKEEVAGGNSVPILNPLESPLTDHVSLLDAHAFWVCDARNHPGALPTCWDATSDSVAARAAVSLGASELVLLKSVPVREPFDCTEATRLGVVDPIFCRILQGTGLRVRAVNLRTFC